MKRPVKTIGILYLMLAFFQHPAGATQVVYDQASDIATTTSSFNNNLSSADDTVQKALDTLDNLSASGAPTTLDYLVGTATGSLSAEIVVGTSPQGELGGTWASPTLDDGVTVTGWVMGASTATTASADDNDTSLATTAFVQTELSGDIAPAENSSYILDAALSADGKYSGITEVVTAGETIAFGDIVYLKAADSQWYLTDADADATAGAVRIAIAVSTGADNGSLTILTYGKIRADANFPALTVGAPVYISTTAGDVQTAQPSGTDDVIRIVGHANSGDELFFCPSNNYMTHT